MSTIVYRIRHKETGLFYQAVKGRWSKHKSNLSKKGRLYISKAMINRPIHGIYVSEALRKEFNLPTIENTQTYGNRIETTKDDWEVVEYELIEIKK